MAGERTERTERNVIELLQELLQESVRLYNANSKGAYEAGRVDIAV